MKKWEDPLGTANLNYSMFSPNIYSVYRFDRDSRTKLHDGGTLIAVSEAVFGSKRRSYPEYSHECVRVEITVTDISNLLIDNKIPQILENRLDT
jgi:hypothetical protein